MIMQNSKNKPVSRVDNPYTESDVHYMVVALDTMKPNIIEVEKDTPGSFKTLQEAKSYIMRELRDRIAEGMGSLDRIRQIGVEIKRLM